MKTYKERTDSILQKTKIKQQQRKIRRKALISTLCAVVLIVGALPVAGLLGGGLKEKAIGGNMAGIPEQFPNASNTSGEIDSSLDVGMDEEYQTVIQALKKLDQLTDVEDSAEDDASDAPTTGEGEGTVDDENGAEYVETTDNQVSGVVESDLIKRTKTHIFYLEKGDGLQSRLYAYSIVGVASKEVSSVAVDMFAETESVILNGKTYPRFQRLWTNGAFEMYLSTDGTRATVIMTCVERLTRIPYIVLVSVDVSDPANMQVMDRTYVTGRYQSSRLVDGKLLLVTQFIVKTNIDYTDRMEYLPHCGDVDEMQAIEPSCIYLPETVTARAFTVVYAYKEKTLEKQDAIAMMKAFEENVYVSETALYFTSRYNERNRNYDGTRYDIGQPYLIESQMTDIYRLDYTGDGLKLCDKITVEGTVNDQYSFDEKDGVLRIVTSIYRGGVRIVTELENGWHEQTTAEKTASLYCIRLSDGKVLGQVRDFAPDGESVQSVRFKGDTVYVCTALVTQYIVQDPVFAFDLSDYQNITWKDTGTIPGYSISLIELGEGYLLGAGYDDALNAKLEVFRQTDATVESVVVYELGGLLPSDYKAFFIEREHDLFGLAIGGEYKLLQFDGETLCEVYAVDYTNTSDYARAVLIDGCFYLFGQQRYGSVWFTAAEIG